VALTDASGKLAAYYEYDAWGNTMTEAEKTGVDNPYSHSTKEWDEKSGLYYFGARYYSPEIGRWTQRDPAGMADGLNLYAYVRADPVGLVDFSGFGGWPPKWGDVPELGEPLDRLKEQMVRQRRQIQKVLESQRQKGYQKVLRDAGRVKKPRLPVSLTGVLGDLVQDAVKGLNALPDLESCRNAIYDLQQLWCDTFDADPRECANDVGIKVGERGWVIQMHLEAFFSYLKDKCDEAVCRASGGGK